MVECTAAGPETPMMGIFVQVNVASAKSRSYPIGYLIQENACWTWVGSVDGQGYGKLWRDGRLHQAHRVIYQETLGIVPVGYQLDHLCRNRRCVNPAHLEIVTPLVNFLRGESPLAHHARKTHCLRGHLLDRNSVQKSGRRAGRRQCLECAKNRRRTTAPLGASTDVLRLPSARHILTRGDQPLGAA